MLVSGRKTMRTLVGALVHTAPPTVIGAAEDDHEEGKAPARLGWWLLTLGFGGFLLWSVLAPLDNGVSMPGVVIVTGERKAVEHQTGGIVAALDVQEGDWVRAGQVLARLDPTHSGSQEESVEIQLATVRATEARLLAERDDAPAPVFPPDLEKNGDANVAGAILLQRQLFESRRAALRGQLGQIMESIAGQRAVLAGLEASLRGKREQLYVMNEELSGIRELTAEGLYARNRLLEMVGQRASLQADIAQELGTVAQTRRQIGELVMKLGAQRDSWQQDLRKELADTHLKAQSLVTQRAETRFDLQHADIHAPVSGHVVALAVHTIGGVVRPGGKLMEIVPDAAPLIVEGHLPVSSVDKVRPGLPVDLLFTAFDRSTTPRLHGQVALVSADRLEDGQAPDSKPYYRVRVRVEAAELARLKLGDQPLRPGMPVDVFVRTGERTPLNYLLKPLRDRLSMAWDE